jgi:short-subunit dehydrogenase
MEMKMTLKSGQGTALITGASSGIGEVYAERLADRGYDLLLVARRAAELEALAVRISGRTGRKVDYIVADLAEIEGQKVVERRLAEDAAITLLVNSAGIAVPGPFPGSDADAVEKMIAINVQALTRLSAAAATAFSARKRGTIVNISSAMAVLVNPVSAAYSASKAYVLNLSRGLHEAVSKDGVHVQAVLPAYTRTPMLEAVPGIPDEAIMPVEYLVDAALAGLDQGETVTIPPLSEASYWDAFDAARQKMVDNISGKPGRRYRTDKRAA